MRQPANYERISELLSQRILPTAEAAQEDLQDILDDYEINAATVRNLIGASKELAKACGSLNAALAAAQTQSTNNQ